MLTPQEKWFGELDSIQLTLRALKDCREAIRIREGREAKRSPLVTQLALYAEYRLKYFETELRYALECQNKSSGLVPQLLSIARTVGVYGEGT